MKTKHCNRCDKDKPVNEFGKCKTYKDGLAVYCKECTREKVRLERLKYPERFKRNNRDYQSRYRQTARGYYNRIKCNAKRKGISFNISGSDFVEWFNRQKLECYYCRQTLEKGNGSAKMNSLNLDRLDNKRGYSLDNIVLSCRRCNSMKGDWLTAEQTKEIAERYFKPVLRG